MKNELVVICGSLKGNYLAVARDSGAFEHFIQERIKKIRSHFWIKSRKMSNGLTKTHYQSKRYTVVCITVRTLSQWS